MKVSRLSFCSSFAHLTNASLARQNGAETSASAPSQALLHASPQQQQQQALAVAQQQHYARSAAAAASQGLVAAPQVEILRTNRGPPAPSPQPLSTRSSASHRFAASSPLSTTTPRRRESSSSSLRDGRDRGAGSYHGSRHRHPHSASPHEHPLPSPSQQPRHVAQPYGGSSSSANPSHQEGVQILSIPPYGVGAAAASQSLHAPQAGATTAFPPPGATIQMIQTVPHSTAAAAAAAAQQQGATFATLPTTQAASAAASPLFAAANPSVVTQQTILQHHHHHPQSLSSLTAASALAAGHHHHHDPTTAAALAALLPPHGAGAQGAAQQLPHQQQQLDPNIKFIFAPPGVAIPPQPIPSYQLVPAGHQVVPVTNGRPRVVNKSASSTAEARVATSMAAAAAAADQEEDEAQDEERLLREPIVLSGKPYNYPVNVGKDVVSGKGGRVSCCCCVRFVSCFLFVNPAKNSWICFSLWWRTHMIDRHNNTINTFDGSLPTPIRGTMKRAAKLKSVKLVSVSICTLSRRVDAFWMPKAIR